MRPYLPAGVALLLLAAGCSSHEGHTADSHADLPPAPPLLTTSPVAGLTQPVDLKDSNPDPAIVEVDLTAAPAQHAFLPGKPAAVWAYNGTLPGPTLRAKVGDKVIVHFHNQLPEATTIHWHGMRVPADMDGMVEVPPGGKYDYQFTLLDGGTYWYHPHMATSRQVERGLYGAIVVDEHQPPALGAVADEILVLDDVLLSETTGALDETTNARIDMMGREGNLLLVGGVPAVRELSVTAGERRLWRLVNAANARYFQVELQGGKLVRVGGDRGFLAQPGPVESLLLVPGQRAMVLVQAQAGKTATLRAKPYERAMGAGATPGADLVRLLPTDAPAVTPADLPKTLATLSNPGEPSATRKVVLDERMKSGSMGGMGTGGMMEFTINGAVFPNVPPFTADKGKVETWEIDNASEMDHPFHLHGFFFQREGSGEWQDTVNVPGKAKLKLRVAIDDRPGVAGTWVYHCHILEHADAGMVGTVQVQ